MKPALLIAERVSGVFRAEVAAERRATGVAPFGGRLRGGCYCASLLLIVALASHDVAAVFAHDFSHAWIERDGWAIDLTATQFGHEDQVRFVRVRSDAFCWRMGLASVRAILLEPKHRHQPWHPARHYDLMVRTLAQALDVNEHIALLRMLDLIGPPYMGKDARPSTCFAKLEEALALVTAPAPRHGKRPAPPPFWTLDELSPARPVLGAVELPGAGAAANASAPAPPPPSEGTP